MILFLCFILLPGDKCIGVYRSDSRKACMTISLYISVYQCRQKPACWVKPLGSCPPRRAPPAPAWCTASTSLTRRREDKFKPSFQQPEHRSQKGRPGETASPNPDEQLLQETSASRRQVFWTVRQKKKKTRYIFKVAFVKEKRGTEETQDVWWLLFIPPLHSGKKGLRTSNCCELWEASNNSNCTRVSEEQNKQKQNVCGSVLCAPDQIAI